MSVLSFATTSFYSANFTEGKDIMARGCHARSGNISIERKKEKKIEEKGRGM